MNINKVVVIGSGTMGAGIAQWFTQNGCEVELTDLSSSQLEEGVKRIYSSWDRLLQKNKFREEDVKKMKSFLSTKSFESLTSESLKNDPSRVAEIISQDADLVIEAIVEDLSIKQSLFSKLDKYFSPTTILSTNTSSISIEKIGDILSKERKKTFLGLHFFNPAPIMKLVEIIKSSSTSDLLIQELYQWFESRDKEPAICKDSPGFIVNRVARNFYGEPLRIANTYDPDRMKEIDHILKEVGGFKMGPFELMDLIGIDVNYSVTCSVWNAYQQHPRFAPHELQKQMVQEKRFGKKVKRGFFDYD